MADRKPQSILVIGAGELGKPVLRHLISHPARDSSDRISVLLRSGTIKTIEQPKKAEIEQLGALGISLVPGDIVNDNEATLSGVFKSYSTIIGCSGMSGGGGTQLKIARAVLAANVRRYIPWQFGVDYDLIGREGGGGIFSEQLEIRDLLRSQAATDWKIVSNGMFMSFLFEEYFGVLIRKSGHRQWAVNALGGWENRVTLTDVEDIGKCTAEVIWDWENVKDQIVFLAGDTISYGGVADILERYGENEVDRTEWTIPHLKSELAKDPSNQLIRYRLVFAEGKGLAWDKARSFNEDRGIRMTTLEAWTQQNLGS